MFATKKSALAITAVLGLTGAGFAQASVLATSMIDMTNFVIKDSNGNVVTQGNQINVTNFASNADQDVVLGAASLSNTNPGSATSIDFNPICVGSGCNPILPNNTFPVLTGPAATDYSAADQLESGSPIGGLPNFPGPAGAHVANGSYVGIANTSTAGSANSNNGLNVQAIITANLNGALTFEFNARAYQEAFVGADEKVSIGTFADTNYSFGFTLTDILTGAEVFSWRPDGVVGTIAVGVETADAVNLNDNCSAQPTGIIDFRNTCGNHAAGVASSGFFSASTLALTAGRLYQLNAFINTDVNAARIPEPTMLGLMGLGLLGFGMSRKRRTA